MHSSLDSINSVALLKWDSGGYSGSNIVGSSGGRVLQMGPISLPSLSFLSRSLTSQVRSRLSADHPVLKVLARNLKGRYHLFWIFDSEIRAGRRCGGYRGHLSQYCFPATEDPRNC